MRVKKFDDFTESLLESEFNMYSYYKGNTKFSRWLRGVGSSLEQEFDRLSADASTPSDTSTSSSVKSGIAAIGRLIVGAGSALTDFLFKGDSENSVSKKSKKELDTERERILDRWESKKIGDRKITEKDAQSFYRSGVLSGKKYFGKDFNPMKPKNKEEKQYSQYLLGGMKRYYSRIHGKK